MRNDLSCAITNGCLVFVLTTAFLSVVIPCFGIKINMVWQFFTIMVASFIGILLNNLK